ncbi:NAD(P)-dependent alcohol dehydrogenase [Desulfovibrio sp. JY]|nr:NAD(P)-dependent alcohol dehydrogenase [Desulfovibrio sp. JY]
MKSIMLRNGFGVENLTLAEMPKPEPEAGQILVKLKAASLNYVDLLLVKGQLDPNLRLPFIPVSDGSGIVEAIGAGVTGFAPGDRVATTYIPQWVDGRCTRENSRFETRPGSGTTPGQLLEYKVMQPNELIKIPAALRYAEAATLPIAGVTAWNALAYGKIKAGDTVLLHGTGGVSIFALQFAKAAGARVIITSGDDQKLAQAQELGADHLINSKQHPDWASAVVDITHGEGADIVVETIGGSNLAKSIHALRLGGHIAVVGFLGGVESTINLIAFNLKHANIYGFSVGNTRDFADMLRAVEANAIPPIIARSFPLEQTAAAFSYLESGRHFGKVVIEW